MAFTNLKSAELALRDARVSVYSSSLPSRRPKNVDPTRRIFLDAKSAAFAAYCLGKRAAVYQMYPDRDVYGFVLRSA